MRDKLNTGRRPKERRRVKITMICDIDPNNCWNFKGIEWSGRLNVRGN